MKKIIFLVLLLIGFTSVKAQEIANIEVSNVLDDWHNAAAVANFEKYFELLSDDAIFIGTDATENWNKD